MIASITVDVVDQGEQTMKYLKINHLVITALLLMVSLFTTSAYAWPEVDHMNMCGTASKSIRTYNGNFQGWAQHDRYVAINGKRYYAATGCSNITSPTAGKAPKLTSKFKARKIKKSKRKHYKNKRKINRKSSTRIKRSNMYNAFRKVVKYDEKADCARVDRMNSY